ncbi:hypothetical protein FHN55_02810 [Streptomyces sp. NP160]|uniref:hypothetical protein n=1 Tax=Streptomyces sp. NP160 TaxID=2586637 RepID=UPI001117B39D|nr:hypothetical protein [Streptomyces sp. NP160]TNM69695.1 hypothetical protein FHN55_02810 [Streptomyces sp. NP160]
MPLITLRPAPSGATPLTTSTASVLRHLDAVLVTALLRTAVPALRDAGSVVLLAEGRDGRRVSGAARDALVSDPGTALLVVTGDRTRPPWVDELGTEDEQLRVAWCSSAHLADVVDLALADGLPQARASQHSRELLGELLAYWDAHGLRSLHDTVVVAGRTAWPEYLRTGAVITAPGRELRGGTTHVGFSVDGELAGIVPAVEAVHTGVRFTAASADRHREQGREQLAAVIDTSLADHTRTEGALYDVVLLSAPWDEGTVQLGAGVADSGVTGRRGGWPQARRYAHLDELRAQSSTQSSARG